MSKEAAMQAQLESRISQQYEILDRSTVEIKPDDLTNLVKQTLDPKNMSPTEVAWLARLSLRKKVGAWLAYHFDPQERAEKAASGQIDAFSSELQERYPTKRAINGKTEIVYVSRNDLSDVELIKIADRMNGVSSALAKHAKNIRAFVAVRVSQPA